MANQNGRGMRSDDHRVRTHESERWRRDDEDRERDRERERDRMRGLAESRWGARRERDWEDERDEGYRVTDRYRGYDHDRQAMDDRYAQRYWEDRRDRGYGGDRDGDRDDERYHSGYNRGDMGFGSYGYGMHRAPTSFRGGSTGSQGAGNEWQPGSGGHRGKGPQGYTRSDDRIKEIVNEALTDDEYIDATHIEVVVKNGEVMLTGIVEDRRQKRMTEDVVERVPGVKDVQNQLRVVPRGNQNQPPVVGRTETETSTSEKRHRG